MNQLQGVNVNSAGFILAVRGWGRLTGMPSGLFSLLVIQSPLLDRSDALCQGGLFVWQRHDQNRTVCPAGLRWPLNNHESYDGTCGRE